MLFSGHEKISFIFSVHLYLFLHEQTSLALNLLRDLQPKTVASLLLAFRLIFAILLRMWGSVNRESTSRLTSPAGDSKEAAGGRQLNST